MSTDLYEKRYELQQNERYKHEAGRYQQIKKFQKSTQTDHYDIEEQADVQLKHLELRSDKKNVTYGPTLTDLPQEVMDNIFGNINIWHHNRIRGTSKRLRDMNNTYVMHQFMQALNNHILRDPNCFESAALRTIKYATEAYVHAGFFSTFCGCILPMLRSSYKNPFCPQVLQVNRFLIHFYRMVENMIGNEDSQLSRILYNVTLLRFFKHFSTVTEVVSAALPLQWSATIELKGPWMGVLWASRGRGTDRINLLVILSEMLIADITGLSFKRVWESLNEIYVFGNDRSIRRCQPKTTFTFTIYGTPRVSSLFHACLENPDDEFSWPEHFPTDQFSVSVNIMCHEAVRWGCPCSQYLEFASYLQPNLNTHGKKGYNSPQSPQSTTPRYINMVQNGEIDSEHMSTEEDE